MFVRVNKFIINLFSRRSRITVVAVSLFVLGFLGFLDYKSGDYSLIVFYLVPVSLVAWFVSRPTGLAFCALTLITRFVADQSSGLFISSSSASLHYWNMVIEFLFLLIMSVLFSTLRNTLEKEKALASTDPLTGALNRRSFFDLAEYELNRSRRYRQPFTVAYIDLDNFKKVNDCLGHHIGDALLVTVISTITTHIRSTDILARLGGDEFVLLLPETHAEAGRAFLEKLHSNMQAAMDGKNWPVSFSIGAISYADTPQTVDEVVQQADALMYNVKHSGRNRLLFKDANEVTNG
jgi:diguanylate cyclase (GGDEF)-like protein